jgi:hypothetical protein
MKIDTDTLNFIQKVVQTAGMVDIDNIIIDDESARGLSENNTVVLLEKEIPPLSVGAIGLNRTDVFEQRLEVVQGMDGFAITAVTDDEKGFVRSLTMKAKGTKIDYRCANPTAIRAPRVINDVMIARIQLSSEAVDLLKKGAAAMGSDDVSITSNKDGVSFALVDVNSDTFDHAFAEKAEQLDKESEAYFTNKYPVKTLLALFKHDSSNTFNVGKKGTLLVKINDLGVYVLPKV